MTGLDYRHLLHRLFSLSIQHEYAWSGITNWRLSAAMKGHVPENAALIAVRLFEALFRLYCTVSERGVAFTVRPDAVPLTVMA